MNLEYKKKIWGKAFKDGEVKSGHTSIFLF